MSKKIFLGVLFSLVLGSSALGQGQVTVRGLLVYDPNGIYCGCDLYSKLLPDPGFSRMSLGMGFADFLSFQNKHVEIVGTMQDCVGCQKVVVEKIVELEPGLILGDPDGDGKVSLTDAVSEIDYLFRGGEVPQPMWTGDVNLDDRVSVGDAVFLINYLLRSGPAPGHFPSLSHQTPCKSYERTYGSDSTEQIIIEVVDDDIIVTHQNAFYNCCFQIKADVAQDGYHIQLYEATSGDPCRCTCSFGITTMICDLTPGTYTISCFNADGQYVGGGEVVIASNSRLLEYTQSGCIETLFLHAKMQNNDRVYFEVNRDTLIMHQDSAIYNCAGVIMITLVQEDSVLNFIEEDTSSMQADCICPFNLTATVVGLESGWYTGKVWNQDMTLLFGQADIYIGGDQTAPKIENDLLKSNLK